MATPWKLYNEANLNTNNKYTVYRCLDPVAVKTSRPWYNSVGENICPCDPKLSNTSGRGFTACPLGIKQEIPSWNLPSFQLVSKYPQENNVIGNLYSSGQYVPPQLQPRELIRIGQEWRSSN